MASRLRIGAALLGAAAVLSFSALPASADVVVKPIEGDWQWGHDVYLVPNVGNTPPRHNDEFSTGLIGVELKEDGRKDRFQAYCVELPTDLQKGKPLHEVPWDKHPNPKSKFTENAGKVLWILTNSFPTKSVDDVNEKFGEGKKPYDDREIIAATQAAIWHFTDGAQLDEARELAGGPKGGGADLVKLYNKFVKEAVSIEQQPNPTLQIDPADAKGKAGEKIGPFKVTTTASEVQLTAKLPKGVTITDAQGNPLTITQSGDELKAKAQNTKDKVSEFFVNVPADAAAGKAELKAKAEAELQAGRLFVSEDANLKTQSLVIAKDSKVTVEKPAKAEWTAAPVVTQPSTPSSTPPSTPSTTPSSSAPTTTTTPAAPAPGGSGDEDLASTGASILWPLVGGLVLVGGGVGALLLVRRKKAGA
ncbi:thioester domain-containing protein [Nocardia sp. NRRL S-836]|uniref:thioester domain-containing protein n=1 Tax=Nocardia sp. NRRL S-836 TaxID=1519492 RepID=UPI0006AE7717|nr:thioester domain-containing protein [Nocardia sp. NRRL S-836]